MKYIPYKVCDDLFDTIDAQSACWTLGYTGGSYETKRQMNWSVTQIPFFMDNVNCSSSVSNFLNCPQPEGFPGACGHIENILLTCGPPRESWEGKNSPIRRIFLPFFFRLFCTLVTK